MPRTDTERLAWIEKRQIAVLPQCNGGWVVEDGDGEDVIELARTRGTLREAIDMAIDGRGEVAIR